MLYNWAVGGWGQIRIRVGRRRDDRRRRSPYHVRRVDLRGEESHRRENGHDLHEQYCVLLSRRDDLTVQDDLPGGSGSGFLRLAGGSCGDLLKRRNSSS